MLKKPITWTAAAVQYAIAVQLDIRRHCIVPNIYLGGNDEMDMAILSPSRLLWEVEIKISLADWRRDINKIKWHRGALVEPWSPARFYYAVPSSLVYTSDGGPPKYPDWLPASAGVITVYNHRSTHTELDGSQTIYDRPTANMLRAAKPLHRNKLEDKYVDEMYRKLSIRYWHIAHLKEPGTKIILPDA